MPDTIDSLQIEINAKATKANDAIDRLVGKLDRLTTSLSRVNGINLNGLANGVQRLGNAMQVMNTIKTADFTRLATNLTKLGTVNVSALNSAASSMSHLTRAFNSLGTVSANAQAVGEMAKNIAKLGNKSVQTAITNIPQLATAMNNLMTTLSRSPQVSQNIIQMTNALANLTSQGSKVGSASNSIVRGLNRTTTATKKASSGFKGLASYIGKFYATYFMVIRGLKGLWRSIESTADYIEAYNYFNVSLGKIGSDWSYQWRQYGYESAESYAESFSTRLSERLGKLSGLQVTLGADGQGLLTESGFKNLGLNIQEITQYASQLASVTNSVGQTGETSLAIASSFTKLAGDISSLFNVDYSSVAKNLQSGLIGQSRALYKYGIDITNATLQTYAYNLGLSKSVSEMTQAEKMQLRMIAILDQSKVSWGDLANTINSPSNMIRQFKNNLKETGMVLGQLFIPLLQNVLPVINGFAIAMKRLLVTVAQFFGIKIDLDAFGQGYSNIEDDIDGITDSYEEATKAAEEYKNQSLGFDEAEKLSEQNNAGKSDGNLGNIDLTEDIIKSTEEYEKAWKEAYDRMESKVQAISDSIYKSFGKVFEVLSPITDVLFNDIKWEKMSESIESLSKIFLAFGKGFTKEIADTIGGVVLALSKFVDFIAKLLGVAPIEFYEKLGEAIGNLVVAIVTFKTVSSVLGIIDSIAIGLSNLTNVVSSNKLTLIVTALVGLFTVFDDFVDLFTTKYDSTVVIQASDDIIKLQNSLASLSSELDNKAVERLEKFNDVAKDYRYIEKLADNYFDLASKTNKTSGEMKLLKQYYDELVDVSPEFVNILNDETKTYEQQEKAIKNVIKQLEEKAKVEAAYSYLVDIEKERLEVQREMDKITSDSKYNVDELYEAWIKTDNELEKAKEELREFNNTHDKTTTSTSEFLELQAKVNEATRKRTEAFKNYSGVVNTIKNYQNELNDLDKEYNYYTGVIQGTNQKRIDSFSDLADQIKVQGSNVAKNFVEGFAKSFDSSPIKRVIENAFSGIKASFNIEGKISGALGSVGKIFGFANGGYPSSYSMFMAGENGVPELLGTVGGRTAVAGGQEITGIREEIRNSSNEEIELLRQQNNLLQALLSKNNVVISADSEGIFKMVQSKANNYTVQTGRPAFMV